MNKMKAIGVGCVTALASFAGSTRAAVIHKSLDPRHSGWETSLDLDANGVVDFRPRTEVAMTMSIPGSIIEHFTISTTPGTPRNGVLVGDAGDPLTPGSPIDAGQAWSEPARYRQMASFTLTSRGGRADLPLPDWSGVWGDESLAIIGVRFQAGDGEHFGWIRFAFEPHDDLFTLPPRVVDWAYETNAGQGLEAGMLGDGVGAPSPEPYEQPELVIDDGLAAAPEPASLAAIAGVAALAAACRRR